MSLFERHNDNTSIVGIDNAGHLLSPCGSSLGGTRSVRHAISNDGSHIYFTTPNVAEYRGDTVSRYGDPSCEAPTRIYLRLNGKTTVDVSRSRRTPPDSGEPADATYLDATSDGRTMLFKSDDELTNNTVGNGPYLYMYKADTDTLSFVTPSLAALNVPLLGLADDGSRVYFQSSNALLDGPQGAPSGSGRYLYVYERETQQIDT